MIAGQPKIALLPEIMIVDDSRANLKLLDRILNEEDFLVRAATNGKQALEMVAAKAPELVLMDVKMPGLDGFEVCRRLKANPATRDIPVLFVSAMGATDMQAQGFSAGGVDYISKPIQREELMARVRVHLGLYRTRRELAQSRDRLEQRVAERTRALEESNTRLARANRAKDRFLATMSHELRTPLHAVLGMAHLLENGNEGRLTPGQAEYVKIQLESGQHLLEVINDVLDISCIEADKVHLTWSTGDVSQLCESALRLVGPGAAKKRLETSLRIDDAVQRVRCDTRRLKQMLVNLLGNAVKFTPEGGRIGLDVKGDPNTGTADFQVWDTGIGIAEQDLSRLFKPFTQLDSSLTRKYEGSGLGLVLVKHLAELQGGNVSVTSTPGEGSRFTIRLSWSPEAQPVDLEQFASTAQKPPSLEIRPLHVLLVEDIQAGVALMTGYLESDGHRITHAGDGLQAVFMARKIQPDVILMDIQLPLIDGLEAIRRIRGDATSDSPPIVALTAHAMPGDRDLCLQAGADAYLTKPVSLQTLRETLARMLHTSPQIRQPGQKVVGEAKDG